MFCEKLKKEQIHKPVIMHKILFKAKVGLVGLIVVFQIYKILMQYISSDINNHPQRFTNDEPAVQKRKSCRG
jgi:uncharacterized membrane protein YjfL (UPF0719 family)